ncbi:class A beta-lactamase [Mycobacterium sp. 1245805.9]|uniref:class A beta-lactamase n=1 Tax=Mycobacterium sp. 1245805.9 TaxID=1856862 RepID=UPI0018D40B12|nr:class A beta-lactamase [Mycobacterium sp. 1245805.9]
MRGIVLRTRRCAIALVACTLLTTTCGDCSPPNLATVSSTATESPQRSYKRFADLEREFDGKIGVYAVDTNNGELIAHRADERFPLQSTIKLLGVAALLKRGGADSNLLQEQVHYSERDLTTWSPVTRKNIAGGMTLEALAEAAISDSDNTAMNLITKALGGPAEVERFAHSVGNQKYNVEHYEGQLNSDPHSQVDTSTPKDMATSVQALTVGDALAPPQRAQLLGWMRDNTVGYKRIRAGAPLGWLVADKTGSGAYGIANDIGIVASPYCKPIVLAIYTVQNRRDATAREDIVATATGAILGQFAEHDRCFKELASS